MQLIYITIPLTDLTQLQLNYKIYYKIKTKIKYYIQSRFVKTIY